MLPQARIRRRAALAALLVFALAGYLTGQVAAQYAPGSQASAYQDARTVDLYTPAKSSLATAHPQPSFDAARGSPHGHGQGDHHDKHGGHGHGGD